MSWNSYAEDKRAENFRSKLQYDMKDISPFWNLYFETRETDTILDCVVRLDIVMNDI